MCTREEIAGLYEKYYEMIWKICLTQLGSPHDACDGTQETFTKFIQCGKKFRDEEHKKAWLIRTAINYCRNVQKSSWNKKRANICDDEYISSLYSAADEDAETNREVMRTLMTLPDKYRSILYLYYYEGYSLKEISNILKVNPSTLRSRFTKAKEVMKEYLEND